MASGLRITEPWRCRVSEMACSRKYHGSSMGARVLARGHYANLNWQIELSILSAALIPKELLIEYLVLTKCVLEHVVSSVCGAVKHRHFNVIGARPAWRNVYYS